MTVLTLNLRRIYLIARRDFMGYVKTWGFWITMLSPVIGLFFGLLFSSMSLNTEPTRYAAILDHTGRYEAPVKARIKDVEIEILGKAVKAASKFLLSADDQKTANELLKKKDAQGLKALLSKDSSAMSSQIMAKFKLPTEQVRVVPLPANSLDALKPYLSGDKSITVDGKAQTLSGVLEFINEGGAVTAKYWTTQGNASSLMSYADRVLRREAEDNYFKESQLNRTDYWKARDAAIKTQKLNPLKEKTNAKDSQKLTIIDNIPNFVAAALSGFLWIAIFSGAYMLLMSMVEEKINKALEMLLASTRFAEILFGKLLGVAALTLASMAPWIITGLLGIIAVMQFGGGAVGAALAEAFTPGLIFLFVMFFILGYLFYGSLFMALGSLAESMQDAQTLVTPILLLLTFCIMVVPIGLTSPDSQLLKIASFIPFSAPFATLIRLPADPPLWEVFLSAMILLLSSIFVVWLSARMFRYGVLSGGGMAGVKAWLSGIFKGKSKA